MKYLNLLQREFPYASAVMITKASQKTNFFGADLLFTFGALPVSFWNIRSFLGLGLKSSKKQETFQKWVPFTFGVRNYLLWEVFLVFPFPEI